MKKILIVDDEQDIVESLKFVLEASDFTCYTADNGEDGLRLAKEIVPDLMILDVMMPKINGYKISRLLKYSELQFSFWIFFLFIIRIAMQIVSKNRKPSHTPTKAGIKASFPICSD